MLSQNHRFHGHGSLRYVLRNGTAIRSHQITLKCVPNPRRKQSRIAVIISKKVVKSAVKRNRVRRRVFEVVREHIVPELVRPSDAALIVVSAEILVMPHSELVDLITGLFRRAH